MTADCLPYDTLCNLQRDMVAYVAESVQDDQIDRTLVVLGIFNGRAYTYAEVGGKSVIFITQAQPSKLGKFEVSDVSPPDYIEATNGDDDHGKGR